MMANSGVDIHQINKSSIIKAIKAYFHEQAQKGELLHQAFLKVYCESMTQFKTDLVAKIQHLKSIERYLPH